MNAAFRIASFIGLILISTTSCVKLIDIPAEAFRSEVVVRGTLNPDSLLTVRLSYSLRPDTIIKYRPINEARVLFYENDVLIGNLTKAQNGLFQLNYRPVRGRKYGIKVQVANRAEITSEDVVPPKPTTSLVKLNNNPANPNNNHDLELRFRGSTSNHWFSAYVPRIINLRELDLNGQPKKFPTVFYLNILSNSL